MKKQVIEEIKNELDLNKGLAHVPLDHQRPAITKPNNGERTQFENPFHFKGLKDVIQEESDKQAEIL